MKNNNNTNKQSLASSMEYQSEICLSFSGVLMIPFSFHCGPFTAPDLIVSLVGGWEIKKKKNKERKKERKKEGKKEGKKERKKKDSCWF